MTGAAPVLTVEAATKRYGGTVALDGVDLRVRRGEVLAVVGPSGCGKSTLLRAVAGLTRLDSGRVLAGATVLDARGTWVPPERRGIGVVFQDHALFPHLRVRDNVAFGLGRVRRDGWGRSGGRRTAGRVGELLELVGLERLADRYPHELSGGEQQRVALARALAPAPTVVLLDEPFSSLDRGLRVRVREETVRVLRAAGATAVLVTHDQEEALASGDRVAVARDGRVEHVGAPAEVFHAPANRFVAEFLGEADFLEGAWRGTEVDTALGRLPVGTAGSGTAWVMVRPHDLGLEPGRSGGGDGVAVVERTEFRGAHVLHRLRLPDGTSVRALLPHTESVPVGSTVRPRVVAEHPLAVVPPPAGRTGPVRAAV